MLVSASAQCQWPVLFRPRAAGTRLADGARWLVSNGSLLVAEQMACAALHGA